MDLISIIIPVHNHFPELKKSLRSIARQTYRNFEVIVVDDGSSDPVENRLNKGEYDFDLHVYTQENKGAPSARNKGFDLSKGDFVIFWDADTIGVPEMLEKMHHVLVIHPEASYVYADFYYGQKKMRAQKFSAEKLKENNYITTSSLIRREDFPYWDKNLKRFQDWDLWLTMLGNNKIGIYIPEFLFFVIPHRNGISSWLPSFAYKNPWRWLPFFRKKVLAYETSKKIVLKKHGLYKKEEN